MEANELRLNNWVYHCNKEVQITIHDLFDITIFEDDAFTPIPLTEKWLLKFGFEYNEQFDTYSLEDFTIRRKDFVLCDIDIEVKFEYVHRLQNAYFELKNKELCYNFVITK